MGKILKTKGLTTLSELLLLIVGLVVICGAAYFFAPNITQKANNEKATKVLDKNNTIRIGVNTWTGFAPLAKLTNGSKKPTKDCDLYRKYGIMADISVIDVVKDSRNKFINGELDVVYCTVDALPTDMGSMSGIAQANARLFGQVDWSRGGDLIVARKGINSVADLKGKRISYGEGTASMSFLIKVLELNNMTLSDIIPVPVLDGIVSAQQFKTGSVDAAVVWTPDDLDCLASQKGSKVLISTKSATNIIPDGLVSTDRYITEHPEILTKLLQAWLETNAELNTNPAARQQAAEAFVKMFEGIDLSFAENGLRNVYLTTYGDNLNFFGLNQNYNGITGEELYTKMSLVYSNLKSLTGIPLTNNPLPWRTISNTSIIKNIKMDATGINGAEALATYTAPTEAIKTKDAVSNKKVSINFETNSYSLDDDDKYIIEKEFIPIAKSFSTRIRVEGNTDGVGNPQLNKNLSYNRAKSVVNYMINEYGFDSKRFIIVGNGSDKAIADGVYSANEKYRVTEFQLISEE